MAYAPEGGKFFSFLLSPANFSGIKGQKRKDIRPDVKQKGQRGNYMEMFPQDCYVAVRLVIIVFLPLKGKQ